MTPFKLVIALASPIIMDISVTLDALLTQAILNSGDYMVEEATELVPLERESGIFKGSCLFCSVDYKVVNVTHISKLTNEDKESRYYSFNGGNLDKDGNYTKYSPIIITTGAYANNMTRYKGKLCKEVYFWGVGDVDKVLYLLRTYITSLGKRFNSGQGQILSIEAYELNNDFSWVTKNGTPARPLPASMWKGKATRIDDRTISFPYWEAKNKVPAVFPTSWVI